MTATAKSWPWGRLALAGGFAWELGQSAAPVPLLHVPLTGPQGAVSGVAFRIAAADANGTIALISLPLPVLPTGNSPANVAYSPDGTTIAVGGTSVQLWSTATRTVLAVHAAARRVRERDRVQRHGTQRHGA